MTTKNENRKDNKTVTLYTILKRVAVVSAIFAFVLCILMIANYIQTHSVDPLNSKALSQLMLQLQENPDDTELKEQIRALDLLARKAYFTNQWQIRIGSYLLFIFVLIILISIKYMSSLKAQLPDLTERAKAEQSWENKILARKYIIFSGLGLTVVALLLAILSENELAKVGVTAQAAKTVSIYNIEEIKNNWPNFRGPFALGIANHTDVPTDWDGNSGKNIIWKVPIEHKGYNSPIVWGGRIFLSGADNTDQVAYCFEAESGTILWQTALNDIPGSPSERPKVTRDTGLAAPTMATDGERVCVIFATGDIGCLDFEGNRVWAKNLGLPDNHYGHASSLIFYQNLLLIQYDQNTGGYLIALKSENGDLVYDMPRDVEISWASPILVDSGERIEIILNSNPSVISYDPMSGEELWSVQCMMGEVGPSLAYADGIVYACNEYARLVAIQLGDNPEIIWTYEDDLSEVASPVATDELLFMAASYGTLSCFNSKTGERYWYHDFDDGFYSSPMLVGDFVYLMDLSGVMYIIKADKEFQLVNQCELGEGAVTIPAFMPNRIYIRGDEHLFCIGNR